MAWSCCIYHIIAWAFILSEHLPHRSPISTQTKCFTRAPTDRQTDGRTTFLDTDLLSARPSLLLETDCLCGDGLHEAEGRRRRQRQRQRQWRLRLQGVHLEGQSPSEVSSVYCLSCNSKCKKKRLSLQTRIRPEFGSPGTFARPCSEKDCPAAAAAAARSVFRFLLPLHRLLSRARPAQITCARARPFSLSTRLCLRVLFVNYCSKTSKIS